MKKSVHLNMILNIMRTLLSVAFPLISYPYATRVLHVDNYGKVSFAQSVISYIALIAALGISAYSIREGGYYRKNKREISKFASEIFSINIISTFFSYIILIVLIMLNSTMRSNSTLLFILSLTVILSTLSVDWINVIYEDYFFITVRSFIIQCISLLTLFLIVKEPDDYYKYAALQVINSALIALSNLVYTRKFCKIRFTFELNLRKHIRPVIILFSNSLAVSIYLNIDTILLGFVKSEYYVGLYSVSVKVYTILKQVVASVYSVTITRMTDYLSNRRDEQYKLLLNDVINNLIFITVPIATGIICAADEIILVLAGKEYIAASKSLKILSFAIIFAVLGGTLANCVNLPNKREGKNLKATILSALLNLGLNIIAIPLWGIEGAALTTLLAEIFVCVYLFMTMKDMWAYFAKCEIITNFVKCIVAAVPFFFIRYCLLRFAYIDEILYFVLIVVLSVFSYVLVGYLLKNTYLTNIMRWIKKLHHHNN